MDDLELIAINKLHGYENNARVHSAEQIELIANSIKEFGFIAPVIIDENNTILVGHGRAEAAGIAGVKKIPCRRVTHLTDEQKKAYILVDNKLSDLGDYNDDILQMELENINLDMSAFGFEIEPLDFDIELGEGDEYDEYDGGYYGDERERTFKSTNFDEYDETRVEGIFDMPTLEPVDHTPTKLIGFNYAKTSNEYDAGIHFYLDDYQFERLWNRPREYLELLSKFDCVMTPNFSIYRDMPEALKIWNTYRARMLGQIMQDYGLTVIPIVYWSEPKSYNWVFDGLPENSTLSTNNIIDNNPEAKKLWEMGMDELIKRKHPKRLILYGNGAKVNYDFGDIEVLYFENSVTKRMKEYKKKGSKTNVARDK